MGLIAQSLEGATPIDDLSGLIPDFITTQKELYDAEFKNITEATATYLHLTPIKSLDLPLLLKIHNKMFCNVWSWAGKIRTTNLNIGIPHYNISAELKKVIDDINYFKTTNQIPFKEFLARIHHRLVYIHPFANGNGRWARLVINILCSQFEYPYLVWPEASLIQESNFRSNYIQALQSADEGDMMLLIQLQEKLSSLTK